jgi:hypothetical protein
MSGPKRNPDKLNTIGVVVVGICGAVMVYVTIVALQAFYMNDTAEMQANKDFGGMDQTAKGHKADEMRNITEAASNAGGSTYRIPIDHAMELVVTDAAKDPSHLIPALPASTKPTIEPHFGRPTPIGGAAPAPAPTGAVPEGTAPATGAPAQQGSGAAPGGAAAPAPGAAGSAAPQTPTGQGPGAAGASPGKAAAQPSGAGSAAH